MKLPLKTRILDYAIKKDDIITIEDIMKDLESEYGQESQFTKERLEEYLDSFLGINFLKPENLEFDENGTLRIYYKITDYGKSREKYFLKKFK